MMQKSLILTLMGTALLSLTGCETEPLEYAMYNPHYWQRVDSSSALYTRGPKAQQKLHGDIANCVASLRELHRLGSIRYVMPADYHNAAVLDPDTPAGQIAEYETPTREGSLRAEHLDYHDFETCMIYHGWERVEHVPYSVAEEAREVYTETIIGEKYRTRTLERGFKTSGGDVDDFERLNQ